MLGQWSAVLRDSAELPLPWKVLDGTATCTRADVAAACRAAGLDGEASGWLAPALRREVAVFRPTPSWCTG